MQVPITLLYLLNRAEALTSYAIPFLCIVKISLKGSNLLDKVFFMRFFLPEPLIEGLRRRK